jgi:hypothetical protein
VARHHLREIQRLVCLSPLDPPSYPEAAKVFDMLLALPKVGSVKVTKILHSCRVSPSKTFGGLGETRRTYIATA